MLNTTGGLQVPKPQFPSLNSPQRAGANSSSSNGIQQSKKVALAPGHSLMDWIRLGQKQGKKLNGVGGQIRNVSTEELASHNKVDDAWMSIRGKVYNITPYMSFHPGGEDEMMRGVGKDGTSLFDDVHQWVNLESMLEKCYIGQLRKTIDINKTKDLSKRLNELKSSTSMLAPPQPIASTAPSESNFTQPDSVDMGNTQKPKARYDWYQNAGKITITIYAKCKHDVKVEHLVIDKTQRDLRASLHLDDHVYTVHIGLLEDISDCYEGIKVTAGPVHRIIFVINKINPDMKWATLGKPLEDNDTMIPRIDKEPIFRSCKVISCQPLTHDIKLIGLELPQGCHMILPMGYHVHLKVCVNGDELSRPYTAISPSLLPKNQTSRETDDGRVIYLMIKIYPDGQFTQCLAQLKEGDTIDVSDYEGNFVESRLQEVDHLTLVAAGTGFTPMVKLLNYSLKQPRHMHIKLLFFNKTEADIPWREDLMKLTQTKHQNIEVIHILSNPDDRWTGPNGRIRQEIVKECMIPPSSEHPESKYLLGICGPTPFTQLAFKLFKAYGFTGDMIHVFAA